MKLRLVTVAALFAASAFGAYYFGIAAAQYANNTPSQTQSEAVIDGLAVDLASLDLGELPEQAHYPASASVRLKLNLVKRNYGEQGLARRPFEVSIHPILKAHGQQPLAWNLHGVIKSHVTLSTAFLDFGEAPARGQTPVSRKVTATIHETNARLEATVEPKALATIDIKPVEGSDNQFAVLVTPDPNLPVGGFSGKVHIELRARAGQNLPGVILPSLARCNRKFGQSPRC
jgi:hypothetical protein